MAVFVANNGKAANIQHKVNELIDRSGYRFYLNILYTVQYFLRSIHDIGDVAVAAEISGQ